MVDRKEEELLSPESRLVVSPVGEGGRKGGAKEQVCGFSGASGGWGGQVSFQARMVGEFRDRRLWGACSLHLVGPGACVAGRAQISGPDGLDSSLAVSSLRPSSVFCTMGVCSVSE